MEGLFDGTEQMAKVVVAACVIVMLAMVLDLCAGLHKAKLRGEVRSSWGLKRTLTKFITYEGSMMIAAGIDLLIHFSRLWDLFGLEVICGVPFVSCLLGVFLLVVEFVSIRETADQKTKKGMETVAEMASLLVSKEELIAAIRDAFRSKGSNKEGKEECYGEE